MKRFAVAVGFVFVWLFVAGIVGYRINVSDSLPHGIYRVDKSAQAGVGDLAMVCVPAGFGTRMGWDRCPPGQHPVLKRILAGWGTCVERDGFTLTVGELAIPLWEDSPVEYTGSHCLEDTEIWLYSPHPVSWDSRYYGPQNRSQVLGAVETMWIWDSSETLPLPQSRDLGNKL